MDNESPPQSPVPVVRLIVSSATGKVLILRRAQTDYAGRDWCLPGGKVDYGETVEEAVIKELVEETGLRHESSRFLFYQDGLPLTAGGMHCINLYFECVATGDVVLNKESSELAWVGPEDVGRYEIVFGNDQALVRYWEA